MLTMKCLEGFPKFVVSIASVSLCLLSGAETKFEIRKKEYLLLSFEKFLMAVSIFRDVTCHIASSGSELFLKSGHY